MTTEIMRGVVCEVCEDYLDCDECGDRGIPAYCSIECAKEKDHGMEVVCQHNK